ncbi:MAG: transketolase [Candidatus Syntrophosphaera sp.]|nr:transketolase [Candidatus Syntrophosphaera sp.]
MTDSKTDMHSTLKEKARQSRAAILSMTTLAGSGHPGGSMSSIDLLLALYNVASYNPQKPFMPERDRVVVSNGHISPGVYSALALNGYFSLEEAVAQFRLLGSRFEGHVEREVEGVEWSSGNLGQGLSAGAGMALASRIKDIPYRVYVLMGDGEQQKGQISEARRFAVKYKLDNLTAIIDYNGLQISGNISDVMPQNIRLDWESEGWKVLEIDGHDFTEIFQALETARKAKQPVMILAHTVMGKGVPFMENQAKYHGSALTEEQLGEALKFLDQPNRMKEYRKLRADFKASPLPTAQFELKCDLQSGQPILYDKETDNRSAWGAAIADLAAINADNPTPIVVVDCDLQASVKTAAFEKVIPERFIQSGIMEHNSAVLSGALSASGIQTFWSDFGMFGLDEVYNMQRLNDINHTNLKVALTHVGLDVGEDGKTHQCIDYIGLLRNLFGFRLICPADPNQTDRVIRWLINKPGNYLVTMGRSKVPIIRDEQGALFYKKDYNFEYGQADVLRIGNKGWVFVTGTPVHNAIKALDSLREEGIYLQLAYVSTPLELDSEIIQKAARTGLIFSIEDHNVHSGLGSILADRMVAEGLCSRLVKIGVESYAGSGTSDALYKWAGLGSDAISARIRQELQKKIDVQTSGAKAGL